MHAARLITDLGDLFPATAVAAVVFAWCWARLDRPTAMTFAICFVGTAVVDTVLKIGAGQVFPYPDELSLFQFSSGAPSGHAALATVVYGAAILLFALTCRGAVAALGVVVTTLALLAVLVTRVTLRTHTIPDVAAGVAVAAGFLFLFDRVRARRGHPRGEGAASLLTGMVLAGAFALLSGVRISSDMFL
ncbi:phosphatase PAP2 family protein [Phenylobacterium aquaticum]|uniref:phosphatase PAP2 family protein n=1 Tax=Phenylobacterium aquaticum TaxID=1763816 RepID=UPI0026ECA632|nr:phosphatase PAP2 family protein [Phenylobacterium aquaticum]